MTLSFVLHNNFLSCVIHSSCVSCLSFCTSVHMAGAVQAYATCHCPYHKVTAHPHSSPLSSAKTGRYLLATWRHLETRWTWAFSHIGQNDSSIFLLSFHQIPCSIEQLPKLYHLPFIPLIVLQFICTLQQELSGHIHLATILVIKSTPLYVMHGHSHQHNVFLFHHLHVITILSSLVLVHLSHCCDT